MNYREIERVNCNNVGITRTLKSIVDTRKADNDEREARFFVETSGMRQRLLELEETVDYQSLQLNESETEIKDLRTKLEGVMLKGGSEGARTGLKGIPEGGCFMKKSKFAKLLRDANLITLQPGAPHEGQHVFHIIANSNGGPDHTHNYLYALGGSFNISIGDRLDHFNCFLAGKEAAKRAFNISMKVAKDENLHKFIEKRNGSRTIFTDRTHGQKYNSGAEYFAAGQGLTKALTNANRATSGAS
jgi:hypothetical protein